MPSESVSPEAVRGHEDTRFETAVRAFRKGPPGVIRRVQNIDSYPGERVAPDDSPDPEAYQPLPMSVRDERQAIADAINAFRETAT